MFTGIIETMGIIKNIILDGSNKTFWIESYISKELNIDQSVSHSGVCMTVEQVVENSHKVTAIEETLLKSNLGSLKNGDIVNLERSLRLDSRLDGHFVQGHVDTTSEMYWQAKKGGKLGV